MRRHLIICPLLFLLCSLSASAQETFTQHLTRIPAAGEGWVMLFQDADIEALVNGIGAAAHAADSVEQLPFQFETPLTPSAGRRVKANGYRIQVYAGSNTRQSKAEAYRVAGLVRATFDDVNVYTRFISPRWTCRVGDFQTHEEAVEMLRRMQQTQKFREASIIKSQIIVVY